MITFVPTLATMAKKTLRDHLLSLSMIIVWGCIGLFLVRKKQTENILWKILILCLLLTPLFTLIFPHDVLIHGKGTLTPWGVAISLVLSVISISTPYIIGDRLLRSLEAKKKPSVTVPANQVLLLIGLACALVPSNVGFWLMKSGQGTNLGIYFVGITYMAALIWWIWWRKRYNFDKSIEGKL